MQHAREVVCGAFGEEVIVDGFAASVIKEVLFFAFNASVISFLEAVLGGVLGAAHPGRSLEIAFLANAADSGAFVNVAVENLLDINAGFGFRKEVAA